MTCIIETERLILRELDLADAEELSKVLSDGDSMKYYPRAFDDSEVREWILRNQSRYREDRYGLWAIIEKSDGGFLGDCGITMQDIDGEILPEVGFHILPGYRRRGYASEAARACLAYAFRTSEWKAVYSYSRIDNTPSQRVMQKIGMSEFKRYYNIRNEGTVVFRISRERWCHENPGY